MASFDVYDTLSNLTTASEWLRGKKQSFLPVFIDPDHTWVDRRTKIRGLTIIFPGCVFLGKTKIGKRCVIYPNTTLVNTIVGDGAEVSIPVIKNSVIGKQCKIGATAELNRATLGRRVSVKHHSFLGDTRIGDETNIGAGTITANYDGSGKKQTRIGKGAFTGIHSSIVAPRAIGKEAMTGAGAIITKGIPPHAVIVGLNKKLHGRSFHKTKTGWEIRKKSGKPT